MVAAAGGTIRNNAPAPHMVARRFGETTRQEITRMIGHRLKRKIFEPVAAAS